MTPRYKEKEKIRSKFAGHCGFFSGFPQKGEHVAFVGDYIVLQI